MPQDRDDLTGGMIGSRGSGGGALKGGGSLKTGGSGSTLYGTLPSSGRTTFKVQNMTGNSSRTKAMTTREKMGRTGETFAAKTRSEGSSKADGKQGSNHDPQKRQLGKGPGRKF